MNHSRDEEIAASVEAHRDLGPAYDDAIAEGLVERIGAEIDRRVYERISQYQHDARPAADGQPAASRQAQRRAVQPGGQLSWQQVSLALGSMLIGLIATAAIDSGSGSGSGTWPIIVIWAAVVGINMVLFRAVRAPSRRDGR